MYTSHHNLLIYFLVKKRENKIKKRKSCMKMLCNSSYRIMSIKERHFRTQKRAHHASRQCDPFTVLKKKFLTRKLTKYMRDATNMCVYNLNSLLISCEWKKWNSFFLLFVMMIFISWETDHPYHIQHELRLRWK